MDHLNSIITIDCGYIESELACAYLIKEGDRASFVETNTSFAVPIFLETLNQQGLHPESVDFIIITHVHLDHAGGTGELLKHCPNAKVLAHPKAAPHIIDPTRLINSSVKVYGEKLFKELYGEIVPVPESRVRIMEDGEELNWGKRKLRFLYTRGHANHHFCIYDSASNGIFTGDSFGLGYRIFRSGIEPFLYPSTTPTDFASDEAILSIDKILATGADKAYLTHFGVWENMTLGAAQMKEGINAMEQVLVAAQKTNLEGDALLAFCQVRVKSYLDEQLAIRKISIDEKGKRFLDFDAQINAQGIAFQVERSRKKGTELLK
ncbi:MBL fold hydrolase [Leptospira perolatii]|uniref:MBL fold hydrolase n=1 Tax=Leptospira perolatii TaxID=2023191 RepID=A0A2M9ZIW0_9LEPT|nr:MBL fold metallo-hydrolase [Leptospira perolatii]PJZ68173.1 MBL fold hydrolase [Leptospira perolatii]PJZ71951.1 MBL fold hydrolase [Leptospira perolatii]